MHHSQETTTDNNYIYGINMKCTKTDKLHLLFFTFPGSSWASSPGWSQKAASRRIWHIC